MAKLCAPAVPPATLQRIASVESSLNPFAIGVVGGRLARQPANRAEALATAHALKAQGWDYSVGLVQVNQKNWPKYGLSAETAFDPCTNLRVGSQILADCYKRAGGSAHPMGDALSCYYAGDFRTGYRLGYVAKVAGAPAEMGSAIPVIAASKGRRFRDRHSPAAAAWPTPLIVAAPTAPGDAVAQGDISPTSAATQSALLF